MKTTEFKNSEYLGNEEVQTLMSLGYDLDTSVSIYLDM